MPSSDGASFETFNPANPAASVGRFPLSTRDDARNAISAAREAFPSWSATPPPQRGRILFKAADLLESRIEELSRSLTKEEGKTISESLAEVRRSVDLFRFYGGQGSRLGGRTYPSGFPRTFLHSIREPVGVVALMTPWNFPIAIPSWKIAPALVSGNSVVFKPASLTPGIAEKLVSSLELAGLPSGVLNLVVGPGGTVGEELVRNTEVDAISFTGSFEVGDWIQRTRAGIGRATRIQLEMGGKNPTVVMSDAKLDDAVDVVVKSAFGLTGQACTATSRVIVQAPIKERFNQMLLQRSRSLRVGNGLENGVEMGPAVSKAELEKDLRYVGLGQDEGAKLLAGGRRVPGVDGGYFMEPTIFEGVSPDMKIAREEIFGPVLSVFEAGSADEAFDLANNSEFGLTACICTNNLSSAMEFANRVRAGVVKINRPTIGLELQVPFGGVKRSSSDGFKEQGEEGIEFYTRLKTVYMGY